MFYLASGHNPHTQGSLMCFSRLCCCNGYFSRIDNSQDIICPFLPRLPLTCPCSVNKYLYSSNHKSKRNTERTSNFWLFMRKSKCITSSSLRGTIFTDNGFDVGCQRKRANLDRPNTSAKDVKRGNGRQRDCFYKSVF